MFLRLLSPLPVAIIFFVSGAIVFASGIKPKQDLAPTASPSSKILTTADWPTEKLQGSVPAFGGKEKLFLVDFWASWCEPCRQSIPFYDELQKQFADQGVQFVGVSADDEKAEGVQFLKEVKFSFPSVWDNGRKLAKKMGIQAIPVLIAVKSNGEILAVESGFTPQKRRELPDKIKKWLQN